MPSLPPVTLVLGGARSGKSTYAEKLVAGISQPAIYIATAQAGDSEMATRIATHRARRGGNWTTIEEPIDLVAALRGVEAMKRPVLIDCLTLWLSNLMLAEADIDKAADDLIRVLDGYGSPVVFVSNEVGLGIVPETPLGRAFRDAQGRLNMRVADRADRVVLMAAGLPVCKRVFAHGWWTNNGEKISKSLGNVIDPLEMIELYSVDSFRYFLLREVTFGSDGDFSETALQRRLPWPAR